MSAPLLVPILEFGSHRNLVEKRDAMYLFFDTETAGLPQSYSAPASDGNNWPRLVQIAWLLTDRNGKELRSQSFIIRPVGFEIPESAVSIHGITTAKAKKLGVELKRALTEFSKDLQSADTLIAHNMEFDERVVGSEFLRVARMGNPLIGKALYCTMRSSTSFCRIPGGPRGYKWPKLQELHKVLFGSQYESAHDAVADVNACAKCFFELKRKGLISMVAGPEEGDQSSIDDQVLFDEIYEFAELCPWFDTSHFVDDVYAQFEDRGSISEAQRVALARIRDMLEEKSS